MFKYSRKSFSSGATAQKRVVITGMSSVTSLGLTTKETWAALLQNKSGIQNLSRTDLHVGATLPEEVMSDAFHAEHRIQMDDRFFTLANYMAI
mmetsp:Transcript_33332/g.32401  ORF Transcript_33332/g.32401 Transcript_33332/m.32401 type:complete len:93 (+) Transcript_33332:29-307(+)